MWATAQAHDAKGAPGAEAQERGGFQASLAAQVMWPTATAGDANGSGSRNTPTSRAHAGVSLTDAVRGDGGTGRAWPTPGAAHAGNDLTLTCSGDGRETPNKLGWAVANAQAQAWPTPGAADHRDRGTINDQCVQRRAATGKQIDLSMSVAGSLNPSWVEQLMGFPAGWTSPLTDGPQVPAKRSTKTKPRASRRSGNSDGNG